MFSGMKGFAGEECDVVSHQRAKSTSEPLINHAPSAHGKRHESACPFLLVIQL